jgi:hypothetical protein
MTSLHPAVEGGPQGKAGTVASEATRSLVALEVTAAPATCPTAQAPTGTRLIPTFRSEQTVRPAQAVEVELAEKRSAARSSARQ